MRLENTVALINGKLINEPFVSRFENIALEAKTVKRGDLFIAFDEESIEEAVLNGAYGIVFHKPTQLTDNEIAWIKVENLEDALVRLLRFTLLHKNINVYSCDEIVLKLALQLMTESDFIVLSGDIRDIYKSLSNLESQSNILFCPALTTSDIFTDVKEIPKIPRATLNIIEQTLFETSFIYDNVFYERQLISPFFIPYLERLLYLLKKLKVNFRLKKFMPIEHFEAVFVNKNFEIKEFGTSDKVLIFEKKSELFEDEMLFLQKHSAWAKTIYIIPAELYERVSLDEEMRESIFPYHTKDEIKKILHAENFHFALVVGVDKSLLDKPLVRQTQLTLNF
jgi:ferrochelatase